MSQYVYNKHNTTWKVLCTVFTHSLFLCQKSYSFAALTRSVRSSQILALPHDGNESIQPSKFDGLFLELFTSRDIKAQIKGEGHKRIDEDDEDRMFEFSKKRLKRRYSNLFTRSPFHCWFARASRQLLWWSRTLEP